MNLQSEITNASNSQKEIEIFHNLLNFFEEEDKKNVGEKKDAVWIEEPMIKAIRKKNFKYFSLLVILGGQLGDYGFEYLVNKIESESESEKFAKKRYLIKILSKIRDQYGFTLLHHAAWKGKLKCLKILIGYKHNVNKRNSDEEQTSCLFMCKNGATKCAKTLFENNVSVNVYDFKRRTPLHVATEKRHQECLELLIRKGGDINAKDEEDLTPLHLAASLGNIDCLEVLLANGANVNARAITQDTPLHYIGFSGAESKEEKERCAESLINAGADIDAKNDNDWTPLHFAASCGNVNCLEFLLANGADVNAKTKKLNTPLHIIGFSTGRNKEEKERCAEMLINAGADINAKDKNGHTIFAYQFFPDFKVERPDLFTQN